MVPSKVIVPVDEKDNSTGEHLPDSVIYDKVRVSPALSMMI
jgi:hypothetical protein